MEQYSNIPTDDLFEARNSKTEDTYPDQPDYSAYPNPFSMHGMGYQQSPPPPGYNPFYPGYADKHHMGCGMKPKFDPYSGLYPGTGFESPYIKKPAPQMGFGPYIAFLYPIQILGYPLPF